MMTNVFDPSGPQAENIAWLMWVFLGICVAVYVLTLTAFSWALARRPRPDDDSPRVSRRLSIAVGTATLLTALTLVALTISSEVAGRGLSKPSGPGAITVDVIGYQWFWDFRYHDVTPSDWVSSPNELHIPVGVPVVINAMSRDVIHSFWVPQLHGKRDLIPGFTTTTWIQADTPGVYRGQCAEFCGHQHARMAFVVIAQPLAEFQEWIQRQRQPATPPTTATQRGHDVFMSNTCVTCHTVRGTQAGSRVGPELTHVGSRRTIAAGTLPNSRDHLLQWVRDPQAIKPGTRMPASRLSDDDLRAVVAYLESLR
jgi:cytochrome c oxidase subunit II